MRLKVFITFAVICTASAVLSQSAYRGAWTNQRHSIGFGLGVANFLGELGGRDQIGSDFIYDLEFRETRPTLSAFYKYRFKDRLHGKAQFSFGYVGGNDALTEEIFRRNRNLHFRSSIFELTAHFEYDVLRFGNKSRYNVVNSRKTSSIYLSLGAGVSRFNPKGNFEGTWYALRPFGTEGQGQADGPEEYSLYTFILPLGAGFRYDLNYEWTIGAELIHRITFTDYIDDVSTEYYDNEIIRQTNGELAAYFADPSLGFYVDERGNEIPLNSTFTGAQRGDPTDNDAYFFFTLTAQYKLKPKGRYSRGRGRTVKRRRRRAVF
jgi:hypothetical protein